jgi:hypothetical protein
MYGDCLVCLWLMYGDCLVCLWWMYLHDFGITRDIYETDYYRKG